MNDLEIESLLEESGFYFDLVSGLYVGPNGEEADLFDTEDVAGELEIPFDDLSRWEILQRHADETLGG
jgi:hypothetical protein